MARLVRCATCGFITEEGKLGDVCPACGAPRKVFQSYEDSVSAERRRVLGLHLHPIIVHFSSAFAVSLLVLTALPLVGSEALGSLARCAAKALSLATPVVVIASMATGVLDGRVRFRRVRRSPLLKRKLLLASVFLASSALLALLLWLGELQSAAVIAGSVASAAVGLVASYLLGAWGGGLVNSAFAGK